MNATGKFTFVGSESPVKINRTADVQLSINGVQDLVDPRGGLNAGVDHGMTPRFSVRSSAWIDDNLNGKAEKCPLISTDQ